MAGAETVRNKWKEQLAIAIENKDYASIARIAGLIAFMDKRTER